MRPRSVLAVQGLTVIGLLGILFFIGQGLLHLYRDHQQLHLVIQILNYNLQTQTLKLPQ